MAIEVTLKWSDSGYSDSRAEMVYQVTGVTGEYEASHANGVPQLNSTHPQNSLLKAEDPFARRVGFNMWEVLVPFSRPEGAGDHTGTNTNPLTEPQSVEWTPSPNNESVDRDGDGNPIINSAKDPSDPPLTRDFTDWKLVITRNESFFDFVKAIQFQNKVNSNTFTVKQPNGKIITLHPGSMLCEGIMPVGKITITSTYVTMAYHLCLREYPEGTPDNEKTVERSPFQWWLPDTGYRALFAEGGVNKPGSLVDATGAEVTFPVRLDGEGRPMNSEYKVTPQKLPAVATTVPTGAIKVVKGDITFLVYKKYSGADFSQLGL